MPGAPNRLSHVSAARDRIKGRSSGLGTATRYRGPAWIAHRLWNSIGTSRRVRVTEQSRGKLCGLGHAVMARIPCSPPGSACGTGAAGLCARPASASSRPGPAGRAGLRHPHRSPNVSDERSWTLLAGLARPATASCGCSATTWPPPRPGRRPAPRRRRRRNRQAAACDAGPRAGRARRPAGPAAGPGPAPAGRGDPGPALADALGRGAAAGRAGRDQPGGPGWRPPPSTSQSCCCWTGCSTGWTGAKWRC